MAALAFLRHWRPLTHAGNIGVFKPDVDAASTSSSDDIAVGDGDDGPFFDLDFSSYYDDVDEDKFSIELEPTTKPQAFTVSLLRSANKLRNLATRRSPKSERGSHKRTTLAMRLDLEESATAGGGAEERRFSKEVVLRYLGKLRPLPARASRRAAQKDKEVTRESGRPRAVVCTHLGKSRSASAAVAEAQPRRRRDDCLLVEEEDEQEEDGINGAIAHCKRSFNASRDEMLKPPLPRSRSDSCEESRSVDFLSSV